MSPDDKRTRKILGIKDEDVFYIPTAPLWELCRQFDEALPGKYELGKALYGFYCKRIKEIAKVQAGIKPKHTKKEGEFSIEEALESFKPVTKGGKNNMVGEKGLKLEPNEIRSTPAASLWELCRSFDEDNSAYPDVTFAGLSLYKHIMELTKTRRVDNPIVFSDEVAAEIAFVLEGFIEIIRRGINDEACSKGGDVTI